jgi:hypothetical protein
LKDLKRIEDIKARLNERLKNLNIEIEVESSFIMMVSMLLEELQEPKDE